MMAILRNENRTRCCQMFGKQCSRVGLNQTKNNICASGNGNGNVLFNDALNTFYLRLYGVRHMVKDHSDSERGNPLRHMGYSFRLAARVLLYASSHRQDNTYHGLCYTNGGALAGTRNTTSMIKPDQKQYPCINDDDKIITITIIITIILTKTITTITTTTTITTIIIIIIIIIITIIIIIIIWVAGEAEPVTQWMDTINIAWSETSAF